ncbi:MAG TPA: universal stress protein [Streptosporangiaceae bacterium]|nr:universal stress protein [Streptosporangiaceae bacterium]
MPGILVGIDGSAHSQRALEWAAREAAVHHTSLTVLTVHQAVAGFWGGTLHYQGDESLVEKARAAAQAETDKVLSGLDSRPTSVTVEAVNGIPAEEILNAGADADMIVLGSRGGGGWSRLLLGSVSSSVAEHAKVPVTILPA